MATPEHLVNLERDKYIYTPFGFSFDKDELNGLECYIDERHIIDSPTAFLIHPKVRKASKPGRQRLRLRTKSRRTK
jgi:hypothetical protein